MSEWTPTARRLGFWSALCVPVRSPLVRTDGEKGKLSCFCSGPFRHGRLRIILDDTLVELEDQPFLMGPVGWPQPYGYILNHFLDLWSEFDYRLPFDEGAVVGDVIADADFAVKSRERVPTGQQGVA